MATLPYNRPSGPITALVSSRHVKGGVSWTTGVRPLLNSRFPYLVLASHFAGGNQYLVLDEEQMVANSQWLPTSMIPPRVSWSRFSQEGR